MSRGESYEEFVGKFEPKRTTDDCYTPAMVYDAVADWVEREYGVERSRFVRPFYPGGDYERFDYPEGCAVVDNPPFSILAAIKRFYCERGIPFFLFAQTMTVIGDGECCAVAVGVSVTYENGANVNTSFVTNMEDARLRTAPDLYRAVKEANDANVKMGKASMPKYAYPDHVVTSAIAARWSKYGVEFSVSREDSERIGALDAQRVRGIGAYGGALLLSDKAAADKAAADKAAAEGAVAARAAAERAAAERAAAERAAAEKWQLSPREARLCAEMGSK